MVAAPSNPEKLRLQETRERHIPWKKWGPYLVAGAKFGRATTTLVASQRVKTSMIVSWTHILDRCYSP